MRQSGSRGNRRVLEVDLRCVHSWSGHSSVATCGGIDSAMRSLVEEKDPEK